MRSPAIMAPVGIKQSADQPIFMPTRSVDGDFLLLELRELLKRNDTIKVVLMSPSDSPAYRGDPTLIAHPFRRCDDQPFDLHQLLCPPGPGPLARDPRPDVPRRGSLS